MLGSDTYLETEKLNETLQGRRPFIGCTPIVHGRKGYYTTALYYVGRGATCSYVYVRL